MPEGGGQGGGGGGHAVLEGSYELHDTVGTGGFAKVIKRIIWIYRERDADEILRLLILSIASQDIWHCSQYLHARESRPFDSWSIYRVFHDIKWPLCCSNISLSGEACNPPADRGESGHQDHGQEAVGGGLAKDKVDL